MRETARRNASLNDVAVGLLADYFDVSFTPSGRKSPLPGASPVVLLRVPLDLKHEIEDEARRSGKSENDVILAALADGLGLTLTPDRKGTMPSRNGSKNGRARSESKVRVAIVGVGNCANSLLQGVEYYKDADPGEFVPGLMHVDLGGYHIRDIEFSAAFDVNVT